MYKHTQLYCYIIGLIYYFNILLYIYIFILYIIYKYVYIHTNKLQKLHTYIH